MYRLFLVNPDNTRRKGDTERRCNIPEVEQLISWILNQETGYKAWDGGREGKPSRKWLFLVSDSWRSNWPEGARHTWGSGQARLQQTGKLQPTRLPEAWGSTWTGRTGPLIPDQDPLRWSLRLTTPISTHLGPRWPWAQAC